MNTLESILESIQNVKVIDNSISYDQYINIDLSSTNPELSELDLTNAANFEKYIENYLAKNKAQIAFGGYNEERNLYKRSAVFKSENCEERNIHIGLDLWIKAGTIILAAVDGVVHSFKNNTNLGDYGPTIILEHQIENHVFYTLYGHLSLESIPQIRRGDVFKKGQPIGSLGNSSVNGDYAPHLHFQIIKDIKDNFGDYAGVCSPTNLNYYLQNCPDPNLLLKIKKSV